MAVSEAEQARKRTIEIIADRYQKQFKYLKSKKCLRQKNGDFTFDISFTGSKYGDLRVFVSVETSIAPPESNCIFISPLVNLTRKYKSIDSYNVLTAGEQERVIEEICRYIDEYVVPFFARFQHIEVLASEVSKQGFLPHRKNWDRFSLTTKRFLELYPSESNQL